MVRNHLHTEFPAIEERIRSAGAERSVEAGYAIGESLAKLTSWIESFFPAEREPLRVHSRHFATRH